MQTPSKPPPPRQRSPTGETLGAQGAENAPSAPRAVVLLDGRRVRVGPGGSNDGRIRAVAERQRGCASRGQFLAAGVEFSAVKRRLRNGRLERIHRGVYRLPHTEELPLAAETGALLACGEGAVLSHHSAVTLWGLRPGTARPIHVTVPGDRGCADPAGVVVHRSVILTPADIRIRDGLPVTSPARAVLDVAPGLTDRDVERLLDEGLFALRILSRADIHHLLARAGSHPGRARLARAVADHTHSTRTDSPPEETVLGLIRAAALPEPRLQAPVLGYVLDFHWPELGLAVEVDAYGTHGSPARFEADRQRDARLLSEQGIVVLRFTRVAVENRPVEVLGMLARAVGRREAQLRG
jgi:very-short-patch-repair endonuclease